MTLISVIIPVYNGEKTIKETILSVLNQTFKDWELIIINDGSTDSTMEIIAQIQNSRIRVFNCENAGLAKSRNRGIDHAQGEFISFLDSDDLWTTDKLETQFQALKKHPEAAVAYSWTDYIDQSNQFLHSGRHITKHGNVYSELLVCNFLENGSNALIRKQVFAHVGQFDTSLTAGEDWDMWFRLAAVYPFVGVPAVQVLYRVSATSMSAKIKNQEKECLKVLKNAFQKVPELSPSLKKKSLANLYKYLMCKSIEGEPNQAKGRHTLGLLWNYIRYEPELRSNFKLILVIGAKSMVMSTFPLPQSQVLFQRLKAWAN
ncbi:glycosyltransferase [Planktothrix paucivesiculata]|uniref:Glycosyltransferase 2-like prokaryotic type domain-containing protein n=1 Tax=Planktothrix paucivesiculata PCC 9631 TaxID=671071 RepID=A0A7Z9BXB1_9CYAN|nr:glycosyltransferase [Planktothrix paucivesiculata]VXD23286.1 conserved hypothetical protein [Planktothrix paucivesiculata PCC 9631]